VGSHILALREVDMASIFTAQEFCLRKNIFVFPAFLLGVAAVAQAQSAFPTKVGIIHVEGAILNTKEGQKAVAEWNAKFGPRQAELGKKQASIISMEGQLRKGSVTMNEDARNKMTRDIDNLKKSLQRDTEDAESDFQQEQNKVYSELSAKLHTVVDKFAKENGLAAIIDVSQPQTRPVFWAADAVNITNEIIQLYDKAYPVAGATGAPAATKTAAPPTAPAAASKKR
jgi:outer membrane protein